MRLPGLRRDKTINLGYYNIGPIRLPLSIPVEAARTHSHIVGVTGFGKSRFLASLFLQLTENQLPATLVDPHGDLARLVLSHLVDGGAYQDPKTYERIVYLDLPRAERRRDLAAMDRKGLPPPADIHEHECYQHHKRSVRVIVEVLVGVNPIREDLVERQGISYPAKKEGEHGPGPRPARRGRGDRMGDGLVHTQRLTPAACVTRHRRGRTP
jgi:hypothetical protein